MVPPTPIKPLNISTQIPIKVIVWITALRDTSKTQQMNSAKFVTPTASPARKHLPQPASPALLGNTYTIRLTMPATLIAQMAIMSQIHFVGLVLIVVRPVMMKRIV